MPRQYKGFVITFILLLIASTFLANKKLTWIENRIALIEETKPDIVVIGNSAALNCCYSLQLNKSVIYQGGSKPFSWWLMMKNIVAKADHRPQLVVIPFWNERLLDTSVENRLLPVLGTDDDLEVKAANTTVEAEAHLILNNRIKTYENREVIKNQFAAPFHLLTFDLMKSFVTSTAEMIYDFGSKFDHYLDKIDPRISRALKKYSRHEFATHSFYMLKKNNILPFSLAVKSTIGNVNINENFLDHQLKEEGIISEQRNANTIEDSYIEKIRLLAQEKGIKLALLRLRTQGKARDESTRGLGEEALKDIEDYASRNNVAFFSIYDESSILPEDFVDFLHMNVNGIEKGRVIIEKKLSKLINGNNKTIGGVRNSERL